MDARVAAIALTLVFVLGGAGVALSAQPVAVLTEVKRGGPGGEVRVKAAGHDDWRSPQPLMSLNSGDQIRVKGDTARVVIVFTGGARQTITSKDSPFKLSGAAPATRRQVASIFGSVARFLLGKEREPVYMQLSTRSIKKDGEPNLVILAPRETRLLPDQVKFAWSGPDTSKYQIRVYGPSGVAWTAQDVSTQPVVYPPSAPKLVAGVRYRWELKTADALPERAQFEIIPAAEWERIGAQLGEIEGDDTTSTLVRVKVLFDERLYQSAREELEAAIARDKTEPNLQFMLGHVYDRMGLREQAVEAFDLAQKLSTD